MGHTTKYVLVKGCAGLGNRLFTVCSAIEYAKATNRTLLIDWSDGQFAKKGVNAFTEYFDLAGIKSMTSLNEINNIDQLTFYPKIWKNIIRQGIYDSFIVSEKNSFQFIPYKLIAKGRPKMLKRYWKYVENTSSTASAKAKNHFSGIFNSNNFPFGSDLATYSNEDVVVFADFSPGYSDSTFLNHIRLRKSLEDKINEFAQNKGLSSNTIGIHVRNTDKQPTKSLDILFKKIGQLDLEKPNIFLATDNKFVLENFQNNYPNVIIYPKFLPETNKEGLHQYALYNNKEDMALKLFEDSIIDMWLLSKCEYLLYQGNSSFSVISKILHPDKNKSFNWLN